MTDTSAAHPVQPGQSARITQRQDSPEHLQRLLAYSYHYRVAHRWRRARALGTFVLAAAGPILSLFIPATSDVVAAISAGWLVLGRTLLNEMERRSTLEAVRVQEMYDNSLFYLPWNTALVGRRPSPDDVAAAARHIKDDTAYRKWYSIELGNTPWPADVLLCQRQSMVWGRQDHQAYGSAIFIAGVTWFLVGVVVALVHDLSLAEYLIKIFLPSAPAFLDSVELARSHRQQSANRQQVEDKINDLWEAGQIRPELLTAAACREIQDSAYLLRRDGPRVPHLFYRLRKKSSEANTQAGAQALRSTDQDV
jgi:hypothetical protein